MALLALHDKRHVLPVLEQHLQGKVKSFVTEKPTTPIASPNMVLLQWRRTQDTTEHVTLEGAVVLGEEAILGCSGWDLLNFMFGSDIMDQHSLSTCLPQPHKSEITAAEHRGRSSRTCLGSIWDPSGPETSLGAWQTQEAKLPCLLG